MNKEQYEKAQKELKELEAIDWESDDAPEDAEGIDYRIQCLRADIFGYQHATDVDYNPYEALL